MAAAFACMNSGRLDARCSLTSTGRAQHRLAVGAAKHPYAHLATPSRQGAFTCRSQGAEAAVVEPTTSAAAAGAAAAAAGVWASFAAAVSGEWDGVTVTFDRDGEAQELPEYYVPQAYRDWDVHLYDWQSQCSMLANSEGMQYSSRRMMPTVGCEADAIAFTEEQQRVFSAGGGTSTLAANGAYTHPPADLSAEDVFQAAAESCLPLEEGQRVRVVHLLKRMGADRQWRLAGVELHRERRDGPHTGRRELAGCGGGMNPFAQQPALVAASVAGAWVASGVRFAVGSDGAAAPSAVQEEERYVEGLPGLVLLPLGTWSSALVQGGDVQLAAGVVLEDGSMQVATQRIAGGRLRQAELLTFSRR